MKQIPLEQVPDDVKAKAQELWPESYEKNAVTFGEFEECEEGGLRWLLEETLDDDFAHLYKDGDKWEVAYL